MIAISERIRRLGLTQVEAARLLRVSQPRVSDLVRGRIDRFTVDTLLDIAVAAGLTPRVSVALRAQPKAGSKATHAVASGPRRAARS
jgi:predicted XRE-type DNA-binding protein